MNDKNKVELRFTHKNERYEKGLWLNGVRVTNAQFRYIALVSILRGKYEDDFVITNAVVADMLDFKKNSVSEMLNKLEELGYVENRFNKTFYSTGQNWFLTEVGDSIMFAAVNEAVKESEKEKKKKAKSK
jgi:DNA-binding MarR family transcriptional regulator